MENNLNQIRRDLALRGKWNIGYFASGFTFWVFIGIICNYLPIENARTYMVGATFIIFPMAVMYSKLFKADPFMKGNNFGELVGYTHMSVVTLSFPIIILTAIYLPNALILVMAILYCLDFYVMSWSFGTWLFGIHAFIRTFVVTILYFAAPSFRSLAIPIFLALLYLSTVILIPILKKKWLQKNYNI